MSPHESIRIRRARVGDVPGIRTLAEGFVREGILLGKAPVTFYEDVQEFWVAVDAEDTRLVGCGALHVLWEDLAEIRTVAVDREFRRAGVGSLIVQHLVDTARWLGVRRIFVLTFETEFFTRHGFEVLEGTPVDPEVYEELLRSFDEGVAEFLDLESVKPNTLGNTRMLLRL
jgi:amino-acid N-acetyltransferase